MWPVSILMGYRRNTYVRLGIINYLLCKAFSPDTVATAPAGLFDVVHLPYFEMSYPFGHLRVRANDFHYDHSALPYSMVEVIGTLLCSSSHET
jgi:hypothetical protein